MSGLGLIKLWVKLFSVLLLVVGLCVVAPPAYAADVEVLSVKEVRTLNLGIARPVGITASPAGNVLFVADEADPSAVFEVGSDETGLLRLPLDLPLDSPNGFTYEPGSGELLAVQLGAHTIERFRPILDGGAVAHDVTLLDTALPDGPWAGFAVDGGRDLAYVLEAASLSSFALPTGSGPIGVLAVHLDLSSQLAGPASGLAVDPSTGSIYVGDPAGGRVLVLDSVGSLLRILDLAGAGVQDLRALTVAGSSDGTDALDVQSLYVVDDRSGTALPGAELVVMELTTGASSARAEAAPQQFAGALGMDVATLVQTIDTRALSPNSPDSAGLTWMPAPYGQLLMSDSEVNEYSYYAGVNLWHLSLDGDVEATGETLRWSREPTGVTFDAAQNRIFTTDDDRQEIYEIDIGGDGIAGTNDDVVVGTISTVRFGNTDPEGITYDITRGFLHIADGSNREIFTIDPGPNGIFEGGNDDVISQFDVNVAGVSDPEGITYDPVADTLAVIDYRRLIVAEFTVAGTHIRDIDVSVTNGVHLAGGTWAPSSTGSGTSLWLVDRGIDGSSPRDGMLYEVAVPGGVLAPAITVIPSSLSFGVIGVGSPAQATVTIANVGTAALQVSSSVISGDPEFSVDSGGGAVSVPPGGSHEVVVDFDPSATASFSGTLTVTSDDPDDPTVDVALSGDGVVAETDIDVSPPLVAFGPAVIGSTVSATVTVQNVGATALQLTSSTIAGDPEFSLASGGGAVSVLPGGSHDVVVDFDPSSTASFFGTLTVASDDPDEPTVDVPLSGDGVTQPPGVNLVTTYQGGSSASTLVATLAPVTANPTSLYVAYVTSKSYQVVADVSGMGATWTPVAAQCGGRNQTGTSVWITTSASVSGVVTAMLSSSPSNAVIIVAEYEGADLTDPIGAVASANTNGPAGACSGGGDSASYDVSLTTTGPSSRVVGAVAIRHHVHEPGVGWVENLEVSQGSGGSGAGIAIEDQEILLPGSINVTGSIRRDVDWAVVAIEIKTVTGTPEPDISLSTAVLPFGSIGVGSPTQAIVTVSNVGNADLEISSSSVSGDPEFSVASGGGAVTVPPGGSHDVTIEFDPSSATAFFGTLTVASDDPNEATVDVALSGDGVAAEPEIDVSPLSVAYGNVVVGSGSIDATVTISNSGTGTLQVSSSSVAGAAAFSVVSGGGAVAVAPGGSHDVGVRFSPSVGGAVAGTLTVLSDDADEPSVAVALSGSGVVPMPDVDVAPASVPFGSVLIGSPPVDATVTVSNFGTATLNVSSSAVSGDPEFSVFSGGGTVAIPVGGSHDVVVRFDPLATGNFLGTLAVASDDPDESIVNVPLSGDGVTGSPGIQLGVTVQGISTVSVPSVQTDSAVSVNPNRMYVAYVASKKYGPVLDVIGMGATWTEVAAQCGARSQTGVTVFITTDAVTTGVVRADFSRATKSAFIAVSEYSGVDLASPIGAVASANSLGLSGACSGGTDVSSYAVPLTTTSSSSRVVGAVAIRHRSHEPGVGWVEQFEGHAGSGGNSTGLAIEDQEIASPGLISVDGTFNSRVDFATIAIEIQAE